MDHETTGKRTSLRLQRIDQMVTRHYDHIWDCCCDHGYLGQLLLKRQLAGTLHFVDVVDHLMQDLEYRLKKFSTDDNWQVHCLDVVKLSLVKAQSHLVIIAGVGGDLVIDFVRAIQQTHLDQHLEFLLCPVQHNYKLRVALQKMGFGLIDESLVKDKKRFYEILHVSNRASEKISAVGSKMWDFSREEDQQYLASCIEHYRRMTQNVKSNMEKALQLYESLQVR